MQGRVGGGRGWSNEVLVLVNSERRDRQPVTRLKQANPTTETVRGQSTVGTVCERRARSSLRQASKAGARCVHRGEPCICGEEG